MQKSERIILFDGICNLCNHSIQFIIRNDSKKKFKFAALQSDFAQKLVPDVTIKNGAPESIILVDSGKIYSHSTAALLIAKQLEFPIFLLYGFMVIPKFIRDRIYKWIAKNRYRWFGKQESCMLPSVELKERFL